MERWEGRVALVTGASSGIGYATCCALVKSGMKVVGVSRSVEAVKVLASELSTEKGSLHAITCDLTRDEDIYNVFDEIKRLYGGVDVCVNNAGMSYYKPLLEGTPEEWRQISNVNIVAMCLCTKLAVQSMKERNVDDGHIIQISSITGHIVPPVSSFHFYYATKHAVKALAEGLRQELREAKSHIRATAISPGIVDTEFFLRASNSNQDVHDAIISMAINPLKGEDIANSVIYALSCPPHVEINDIIVRPTLETY